MDQANREGPRTHDETMGVSVRECGGCTACCEVLDIPRLAKPAGVRCHNLTDQGCGIYDRRPMTPCRDFACAWLQGFLEDDDRPDKSGAIIWQAILNNERTTIVSQVPNMEISDDVVKFLQEHGGPVRLERLWKPPETVIME